MRRNIACSAVLMTLLVLLNCRELNAADVLDQSNVVAPGTTQIDSLIADVSRTSGQTVRAGLTGTLSRVELGVYREYDFSQPLFVDIVRTQSGQLSFAAADRLATRTVTNFQVPLLTTFAQINAPAFTLSVDYSSSNLTFNSGDMFGIVLRSDSV